MLGHDDHDHHHCRADALARVEDRCATMGLRLTAQRRRVLDVLLDSHVPVTAYEIMDRIGATERRPSPISVYRALDFLVANRFAHRIESRNAFLACSHGHGEAEAGRDPMLVFLLCEACGAAAEAEPPALAAALADIAGAAGFQLSAAVLELRGVCAACRAAGRLPQPRAADGDDA
ncbi:Fur family transcriptional regulator [Oharaeibacter diazotrophicus]|uniref:Fur family zinc uptake transcriptional regulator n=2 Tax=Oharaeibacter diazotrophicus TaxID=1920512 RepID=A0A4R6RDG5_9HYPH|nr:transcriptional repressor [Oharaeibacter diazotrophicus]TDP84105.1 Fur family zinc uptake transcriptional regulator [Oharaeibacter diazotrophicus]BBE73144.1 zinc uptake regulation protein [Pleomorphomonas sp. SM30]GLS74933.1 ABC transporter ATP-binding protein [Oharaeibacter diazotrophicus]